MTRETIKKKHPEVVKWLEQGVKRGHMYTLIDALKTEVTRRTIPYGLPDGVFYQHPHLTYMQAGADRMAREVEDFFADIFAEKEQEKPKLEANYGAQSE